VQTFHFQIQRVRRDCASERDSTQASLSPIVALFPKWQMEKVLSDFYRSSGTGTTVFATYTDEAYPKHSGLDLAGGFRSRSSYSCVLLETAAAEHRSALCRLKWNSGFGSALGTRRAGFRAHLLATANPFRLALFAALGVIFELFVVEEDLLARGKDKIRAAVNARKYPIGEFHGRLP
jgi:hypothetical protein